MADKYSLLEQDLSCPVCCDIFNDPVVLTCSHSFCRSCLEQSWEEKSSRECPVCKRKSSMECPPLSLALKNLCETIRKERGPGSAGGFWTLCRLHGQELKSFCMGDKVPVCGTCQTSRKHTGHHFLPAEEAAQEYKEELKTALITLQEKLEAYNAVKQTCDQTVEYIERQIEDTERQIKREFKALYQFLQDEENASITAVREEGRMKSMAMKKKVKKITHKMSMLTKTIRTIQLELRAEDVLFLQNCKNTIARAQNTLQYTHVPTDVSAPLVDVARHVGSLKFRVWEKMQEIVHHYPVTLDPNTAHPSQSPSEQLTSLTCVAPQSFIPNNLERFDISNYVLGSQGFSSGKHYWDVDVRDNPHWVLGVARESITRKGPIDVCPGQKFSAIWFYNGEYQAMTSPLKRLHLTRRPQRIRVQLNWNKGTVSFFDPTNNTQIFCFRERFTETMLPLFSNSTKGSSLNICPMKVAINGRQKSVPRVKGGKYGKTAAPPAGDLSSACIA